VKYRLTRDLAIVWIALGLLCYEIVLGEARATALTAVTGLLLSPLVLRLDEARRSSKDPKDPKGDPST
jgi:hypothetical protein